jgi:hypothetical protein
LWHFGYLYFIFRNFLKELLWIKPNDLHQLQGLLLRRFLLGEQPLIKIIQNTTLFGQPPNFAKKSFNPFLIGKVSMVLFITTIDINPTVIKQNILNIKGLSVHGLHVNLSDSLVNVVPLQPFLQV